MICPFKAALGVGYKDFEDRLEDAIHIRFGLPAKTPPAIKKLIKQADRACAFFEATQLAGFDHAEALAFFGAPPAGYDLKILTRCPPFEAQARYVQRFHVLSRAAGFEPRPARRSRPNDGRSQHPVVIGLSAVVVAIRDGEAVALTVRRTTPSPTRRPPARPALRPVRPGRPPHLRAGACGPS